MPVISRCFTVQLLVLLFKPAIALSCRLLFTNIHVSTSRILQEFKTDNRRQIMRSIVILYVSFYSLPHKLRVSRHDMFFLLVAYKYQIKAHHVFISRDRALMV